MRFRIRGRVLADGLLMVLGIILGGRLVLVFVVVLRTITVGSGVGTTVILRVRVGFV